MEEQKNNAMEKTEHVIRENEIEQGLNVVSTEEKVRAENVAKEKALADQRIKLAIKKEERKREKQRLKKERQRSTKGKKGWLAAVVSLSIATIVLATVLTVMFLTPSNNDKAIESVYQKSFYDTVEQVDNIDLNLSKALATNDNVSLQTYLVDTAINSELAENDLQQLPLNDESKFSTTKLVNQIGDYSKYLNKKLAQGNPLTTEERDNLKKLYSANKNLREALDKMIANMGNDYSFSSLSEGGKGDVVLAGFDELENLSVSYPQLIYDGPFSDGMENREIRGATGQEISLAEATDIYAKIFASYNPQEIEALGETTGKIKCYNIQSKVNGELLYAQITKDGGTLLMFDYAGSCMSVEHDKDYAQEQATNFLTALGLTDMKAVWFNLSNNVYTMNFASTVNGVIAYPDLIKVRVCAETGMVIGLEASSYYMNHYDRSLESPTLTMSQARSKVLSQMEITSERKAIVPIGNSGERLCYEFAGEYDGSVFYVYIDADTGAQVEMFKVIESTEGTLLM